jgi:hypothetical protein
MTDNELTVSNTNGLMPALTLEEAALRYNTLVTYTREMMKSGKDFGIIPGTGDKPTLLKPGAEKLCSLFGLFPEFETIDNITDFENGLFYFRVKCVLYRNGKPIASGVGSCNSMEKKYRYRYIVEWKATDEDKARAVDVQTKNGQRGPYKVYKVENKEPFELVNTIDKMAQKRALVAATLIGANASEFYTQDIEDMGFVEGSFTVTEEEPPKQKKAPAKKVDPAPEPQPEPMTIEQACKVKNSKGADYGSLTADQLSMMSIGITKGLVKSGLTEEKKQEYLMKQEAVKVLLQANASGEIELPVS